MKKYWTTCLLCMMLLVLSGCQKEEKPIKVIEKEPVKIISLSITPMAEEEKQEEEEEIEGVFLELSDGFPINTEMEIDVEEYNAINRKLTRDMDSGASLFCIDKKEAVYFVNQNKDNYLYCMKEGVVELVVDLPVKEVYFWDDVVYFMIASANTAQLGDKKTGDIYCYIPETKEVNLVYALGDVKEAQNHKMTVNEQGIHFNYSQVVASEGDMTRMKVFSYTLPFGATQPIKDTAKLGKAGWGDYYFSYEFDTNNTIEPVKVSLVHRTKGKSDTIPVEFGDFQYCVANDKLYSTKLGSSTIFVLDLQTKKTSRYDFRIGIIDANSYYKQEIEKSFGKGMEEIISFTVTENGNVLWATDGEYLYRMDTEYKYAFPIITNDENRRIEKLYSDGRRVYGLYSSERTGVTSLVRFCTEVIEQDFYLEESVVEVEYLTE